MSDSVVFCDGAFVFCKALASRLEDGHKKGINAATMMNFKTGEDLPPLILYKSSASDHGLILNNCPWCGKALNRKVLKDHRRKANSGARNVGDVSPQAMKKEI